MGVLRCHCSRTVDTDERAEDWDAERDCCSWHAVEVEEQAEAEQTLQQQQMAADDQGE